jgi:hypothetical protein
MIRTTVAGPVSSIVRNAAALIPANTSPFQQETARFAGRPENGSDAQTRSDLPDRGRPCRYRHQFAKAPLGLGHAPDDAHADAARTSVELENLRERCGREPAAQIGEVVNNDRVGHEHGVRPREIDERALPSRDGEAAMIAERPRDEIKKLSRIFSSAPGGSRAQLVERRHRQVIARNHDVRRPRRDGFGDRLCRPGLGRAIVVRCDRLEVQLAQAMIGRRCSRDIETAIRQRQAQPRRGGPVHGGRDEGPRTFSQHSHPTFVSAVLTRECYRRAPLECVSNQ